MFHPDGKALDLEVLIVPDSTLILTAAVLEPLRAANRILGQSAYRWSVSTPDGRPAMTTAGFPLPADRAFDPAASAAPLLVIASYNIFAHMSRDLLRRVSAARRGRPMIGAVEAGVYLLAEAGLLNGRSATVHWEDRDDFARRYPEITLRQDRFVIEETRCSAGAASPALDMMLELIRRRQGQPLSIDVAKLFAYSPARPGATGQGLPSLGALIQSDDRVARAVRLMEEHLDQPLGIDDIARRVGVSARHLQSLFQTALGVSPKDYYQSLRLALARRQIIESSQPISEIAGSAGFSSLAVFSRAYAKRYGENPSLTRRRG